MKYDVIIMGAGPNGLATALALGGNNLPRPLRVLVLDGRHPHVVAPDSRGTALTRATQTMFQALGVWDSISPHTAEMRDIIVTDGRGGHAERPSLLSFHTGDGDAAACIVENEPLNAALLAAVLASPHIALQGDFQFAGLETSAGSIELTSASGIRQRASVLIAADGRQSPVRHSLGIAVNRHDYGQVALSFSISHEHPHDNLAEEHFSPDGVFAVLPLPGQACSIVWGMSGEDATTLMALEDNAFLERLQTRMGPRLGRLALRGKRGAFPLIMQIAKDFIAARTALLGDAAHAIHPLAGLGLNLGFKDAAALADIRGAGQCARRGLGVHRSAGALSNRKALRHHGNVIGDGWHEWLVRQ